MWLYLPLTSVPAILVFLVGIWVVTVRREGDRVRRWILFLLVAAVVMALPLAVYADRVRTGNIVYILLLEIPAMIGVLALLLINARDVYARWQAERGLLTALLLALVLLLGAMALGDPTLPLILLLPGLVLAGVWAFGRSLSNDRLAVMSALLVLLQALDAVGEMGNHLVYATPWLRDAYKFASGLALILVLVFTAILIGRGLQAGRAGDRRRSRLYLTLVIFLVLGLAANTFRNRMLVEAAGHAAEDHMPLVAVGLAVIIGLLLVFGLREMHPRLGLAFILLVPTVITLAYAAGGLVDPEAVTTSRAERINQALARYQQETGAYPSGLAELTPGYLPYILGPLTGRGQTWCYQGSGDFYRLGYAYYQRYPGRYPPRGPFSEVRIHSAAGQPPLGPWMCDDELELIETTGGL